MIDVIEFTDNTRALSVTESAQFLQLDPTTVRKYLKDGKLHGEKIKGRVYINEAEIMTFKKERGHR